MQQISHPQAIVSSEQTLLVHRSRPLRRKFWEMTDTISQQFRTNFREIFHRADIVVTAMGIIKKDRPRMIAVVTYYCQLQISQETGNAFNWRRLVRILANLVHTAGIRSASQTGNRAPFSYPSTVDQIYETAVRVCYMLINKMPRSRWVGCFLPPGRAG